MANSIHLDFETFSTLSLPDVGLHNYSQHPSTDIICMSWKIKDQIGFWKPGDPLPKDLFEAIKIFPIQAWNSNFEKYIWKNVLVPKYNFPDTDAFICSMALAMSFGIPASLKNAGKFLELPEDNLKKKGTRLINKLSVPRRITKTNSEIRWTYDSAKEDFEEFFEYNKQDVLAEEAIIKVLPRQELFSLEKKIWNLTGKINEKGLLIDLENVKIIKAKLHEYNILQNARIKEITGGLVGSALQRDKGLDWLKTQNVCLPDLTAKTVEETLNKKLPDLAKEYLEIRQALSQSSVKKYVAMINHICPNTHRIYNPLMYHAATTGRFSGKGIQIQNIPRESFPSDLDAEQALFKIRNNSIEEVEKIYEMDFPSLAKKLLRQIIIAPEDKVLLIGDFSSIENRISAWLAKDKKTLDLFSTHLDQYVDMACNIWKIKSKDVTKAQRSIAKGVVLGAMFGLGAKGLQRNLNKNGVEISEVVAKEYVDAYRKRYPLIVNNWWELENKTIKAIQNKSLEKVGDIFIKAQDNFLFYKLPVGRVISFFKPALEMKAMPWGEEKQVITFKSPLGRNSLHGALIHQNVVQGLARDILCNAMINLDDKRFNITMTVHDELVVESEEDRLEEFKNILTLRPSWANDLPLDVEVFSAKRYRK